MLWVRYVNYRKEEQGYGGGWETRRVKRECKQIDGNDEKEEEENVKKLATQRPSPVERRWVVTKTLR